MNIPPDVVAGASERTTAAPEARRAIIADRSVSLWSELVTWLREQALLVANR